MTDHSCVTAPSTGFIAGLCIHHDGDMPCPAGFADRHVFYSGVDDQRGCTPCTCGLSSVACPTMGGAATGSATPTGPVTYCCAG
jgi:hypothetical protein